MGWNSWIKCKKLSKTHTQIYALKHNYTHKHTHKQTHIHTHTHTNTDTQSFDDLKLGKSKFSVKNGKSQWWELRAFLGHEWSLQGQDLQKFEQICQGNFIPFP